MLRDIYLKTRPLIFIPDSPERNAFYLCPSPRLMNSDPSFSITRPHTPNRVHSLESSNIIELLSNSYVYVYKYEGTGLERRDWKIERREEISKHAIIIRSTRVIAFEYASMLGEESCGERGCIFEARCLQKITRGLGQ